MSAIQGTRQCQNCQQANPITATHCTFCGQSLLLRQDITARAGSTPSLSRPGAGDVSPSRPSSATGEKPAAGRGGLLRRAVADMFIAGLACALGTALPHLAVAVFGIGGGSEAQRGDAISKAIGFAVMGAIFGWFADMTLGRWAATRIIPPVLFVLSLYFLWKYG